MALTVRGSTAGWRVVLAAAAVGFAAAFVLSSILHLRRALFLGIYSGVVLLFFAGYVRSQRMNFAAQLERRWVAGVLGGLALGTVLMFQVLSQPVSPRAQGTALVVQLLYYGVLYGTVDALLLSVLPVLVLYGARDASQLQRATGRLRFAGVALLGSALVTAAYHAGFAEFRGAGLVRPVIGNLVITLGYLLTGNPLGSIVAHVAMHSAAVLHGMEGTSQLPPHY